MNYLLTVSLLLLVISPAYYILVRYSSNYGLNRLLLLLGIGLVFLLPRADFTSPIPTATSTLQGSIVYLEEQISSVPLPEATTLAERPSNAEATTVTVVPTRSSVNWVPLVYTLGLSAFVLLFLLRTVAVIRVCLRSRRSSVAKHVRILPSAAAPNQAFTFGWNIYLSDDMLEDADLPFILAHEKVHARQGHTLDLLFAELFLCIFWFHPLAWWFRGTLRANLEYLVDAMVAGVQDKRAYQLALVRQSQRGQQLTLALPFSEPTLKGRISRLGKVPRHRLTVFLSAVGLLFWLGTALTVMNGTALDMINLPKETDGAYFTKTDQLTFLFQHQHQDVYPEKINEFAVYFRRLPTVEEYSQINAILRAVSYTELNVFPTCSGKDGEYVMELGHWLNEAARARQPLREGQLLENHGVLKLKPRTVLFNTSEEPHPTAGYFTPISRMTLDADDIEATFFNENPSIHIDLTEGPGIEENLAARGIYPSEYRFDIADEEIAVYVNGERFPLDQTSATQFFELAVPVRKPADARLQCHLGGEQSMQNIHVHTRKNYSGAVKKWVKKELREIRRLDRPIHFYYNDEAVSKEEFMRYETIGISTLQVGYHRTDEGTPIIVQLIDDLAQ